MIAFALLSATETSLSQSCIHCSKPEVCNETIANDFYLATPKLSDVKAYGAISLPTDNQNLGQHRADLALSDYTERGRTAPFPPSRDKI